MAKHSSRSKIKSVIYGVLSFILSLDLFALAICGVLETTFFNTTFLFDNMNASHYFDEKRDEITDSLVNLSYASGLEESFFDDLVSEVMINTDTQQYLEDYFAGDGTFIDTTQFEEVFNTALDEYIETNNIENVDQESRDYLVDQGAWIYRTSLEIPLFTRLSAYILTLKNAMPFVIGGLAAVALIICLIMILTNYWKHRAVRYICYATSGAFIAVAVIPAAIVLSGKITQANFASRALYNFFVQGANNFVIVLLCCALLFLLVSVALFAKHHSMYKKLHTG